jgi:hypothetical protein
MRYEPHSIVPGNRQGQGLISGKAKLLLCFNVSLLAFANRQNIAFVCNVFLICVMENQDFDSQL